MKHSRKSNRLQKAYDQIDDMSILTDKQKREERRRLKKARSKLERRERKRFDDDFEE